MPYDPALVQPLREELTRVGVEELTRPEDAFVARPGQKLLILNSVCGCAAGG
ncbi:MAG: BrxA/BrxB family bacilliredoxin [Planctomycetota bacterium]